MNTADKKVVLDAITEAAVCLAAIPDFMAGERIANALHQLQRAGDILEMEEKTEEPFFELGVRYQTGSDRTLEFIEFDKYGDPLFKEIGGDYYGKNDEGLVPFFIEQAYRFTKL